MKTIECSTGRIAALLSLIAMLTVCQGSQTSARENSSARSEGKFSAGRLETLTQTIQADIDAKRIPGAVVLIASDGNVVFEKALGQRNPQTSAPMTRDAIFRIHSMVSVGVMMLVEDGKLLLSDPASQHLPELKSLKVAEEKNGAEGKRITELVSAKQDMTVLDLLRHTSGLTGSPGTEDIMGSDDFVKKIAKLPLAYHPGSGWKYGHSTNVLGVLIERVSRKPLDEYLRERILKALKMEDTGFWVEPSKQDRLAEPFEMDPETKKPTGFLGVGSRPTFLSGSGGMVSVNSAGLLALCANAVEWWRT